MAYDAVKEVFEVQKSVRLRKKSQVTIPTEIIELLHLNEGDNLNIQVENGRIVLVPTVTIAKDQAWFWTESWQQAERQAERDVEKGRLTNISNKKDLDAFFDTLDK
ncbi:AbrB/MazE/SpoVT family DNA-binding domain-containing protein [Paenibacillus sp. FA6]|uniref:AbrB/MazE/SpoVT family DNA-binding domain-containing protein n=1 Tax=Paenibacillus sp. FA6 TaxID=3413029 RepID=UPI003F654CD3